MSGPRPITGSYAAEDCLFLLTPLPARFVTVEEKERLIQREGRHYSEMISREAPPEARYLELFQALTARYRERLAREVVALAGHLAQTRPAPIAIVSLARAGTPFGALLRRALGQRFATPSAHYSISIIRDRGIDEAALQYLLRTRGYSPSSLVFVDAWTAKGVITRELKAAIAHWNARGEEQLDPRLYVIADVGGSADAAATYDDYAIPSGVLNATVSGLVSRTILNERIAPGQFHGCVLYDELAAFDQTNWFLEQITAAMAHAPCEALPPSRREERAALTEDCVRRWQRDLGIADINYIKPGVAEATRVMLRRVPERLMLRDAGHPDVAHLRLLAERKGIPMSIEAQMPFNAVAFIKVCQ